MWVLGSWQAVQQTFNLFLCSDPNAPMYGVLLVFQAIVFPENVTRAMNKLLPHARVASHLGPVNLRLANFHARLPTIDKVIKLILDKWNPSNPQN